MWSMPQTQLWRGKKTQMDGQKFVFKISKKDPKESR